MDKILERPITIEILRERRNEIMTLVRACGGIRVRVFGSAARGESTAESDVDFLVQFNEQASMWEIVRLWRKLGELLGCDVSVIPETEPKDRFMENALRDAVEL